MSRFASRRTLAPGHRALAEAGALLSERDSTAPQKSSAGSSSNSFNLIGLSRRTSCSESSELTRTSCSSTTCTSFDEHDSQLDEARHALIASIAALRAAELRLDDIQHARSPDAEHAAKLCKRALGLRDALHQRLLGMFDDVDDHNDVKLPQRLNAGSPDPQVCASRRTLSVSAFDEEAVSELEINPPQPTEPLADRAGEVQTSAGGSVLDRVSAVLIDVIPNRPPPYSNLGRPADLQVV